MYGPPIDPRDRTATRQPTWRDVLAAYALLAAVVLSVWVVSNPLAGTAAITGLAVLATGGRRVANLVRCFHDCGEFAFHLARNVRITVTNTASEPDPAESGPDSTRLSECC